MSCRTYTWFQRLREGDVIIVHGQRVKRREGEIEIGDLVVINEEDQLKLLSVKQIFPSFSEHSSADLFFGEPRAKLDDGTRCETGVPISEAVRVDVLS